MTDTTGVLPCGTDNTFGADADEGPFIVIMLFFAARDDAASAALSTAWLAEGGTAIAVCDNCCSGKLFGGMLPTTGNIVGLYVLSFPTRTQAEAFAASSAVRSIESRQLGVIHRMASC